MRTTSINTCRKISNIGFSVVELIVVVAVVSILVTIIILNYMVYKKNAKKEICRTNGLQLERMYESYLLLEEKEHLDNTFNKFVKEYGQTNCPDKGEISYIDEKVKCGMHSEADDEVPYL